MRILRFKPDEYVIIQGANAIWISKLNKRFDASNVDLKDLSYAQLLHKVGDKSLAFFTDFIFKNGKIVSAATIIGPGESEC